MSFNSNDYTTVVDEFGIRTFNILKNWFQELEKENIEFGFMDTVNNKSVFLSRGKISDVSNRLKLIKTKEVSEPLDMVGTLLSASSTNNSFEIRVNDTSIKGKTSAEIFKNGLTITNNYRFILTKKILKIRRLANKGKVIILITLKQLKHKPGKNSSRAYVFV